MEAPSPARLYAAAVGALLVVLGLLGFFYTASFDGLGEYEEALGGLQVNGWLNLLYIGTGALGLLLAAVAPRDYCLAMALLFAMLTIFGWGTVALHLVLGLVALAAFVGTRSNRKPRKRKSKPRTKPAGKRA